MSKIALRGPKDKLLETYSLSFEPISKITLRGPKDKVKSILETYSLYPTLVQNNPEGA